LCAAFFPAFPHAQASPLDGKITESTPKEARKEALEQTARESLEHSVSAAIHRLRTGESPKQVIPELLRKVLRRGRIPEVREAYAVYNAIRKLLAGEDPKQVIKEFLEDLLKD
jgi:hypothetical protein